MNPYEILLRAKGTEFEVKYPQPRGKNAVELESAADLREGQKYRLQMDGKGHLWDPESGRVDPMFYCGLSPWLDEDYVVRSGYEDFFGPYRVYVDDRKGNDCATCKQWRKRRPPREVPKSEPRMRQRIEERQLAAHAGWVARELGAEIL